MKNDKKAAKHGLPSWRTVDKRYYTHHILWQADLAENEEGKRK